MNHVIIGNGQIGKTIKANIKTKNIKIYDKGEWENIKTRPDVLHICIPYTNEFKNIFENIVKVFSPLGNAIIIIHSTIKAGTTKSLHYTNILYSPVNARHSDNIAKNILNYPKLFAGNIKTFNKIKNEFKFKCIHFTKNYDELEYAKIMCTGYMYWNLVYQKIIHRVCKSRGYNFTKVYTDWNKIINKGLKIKHPDWQRPIYKFDDNPVPGGHCLSPNTKLDDNFINIICAKWDDTKGEFRAMLI